NALEMPQACLIEAMIRDKGRLNDPAILSDSDHREVFHIEIYSHSDQVRVLFAQLHFLGVNLLDLWKVQCRPLFAQDQLGTLGSPGGITPACFKVAAQLDGIVVPFPTRSGIDLEASKAGAR